MTEKTEEEINARHSEKMAKKKAARDKILATKTEERGLVIVNTGKKFSDQVTIKAMGEGFTWETQDRQRDIDSARAAWEEAKLMIANPDIKMVLCDELNIVLRYDYLPVEEVVEVLKNKPEDKHVIVTGRNAKDELIDVADLVTEMELIKHPFRSGVKAQAGVEF